jgi:2-keto-4-pentenoate hydratase/2-oxohepta-3-ene-1,7-dioic acid hydratase in catechol pathway
MRFVTVETGGRARLGILEGEHVYLFAPLARMAARERAGAEARLGPRARRSANSGGALPDRVASAEIPDDMNTFIERGSLPQARDALRLGRALLRETDRTRGRQTPQVRARGPAAPAARIRGLAIPLAEARLLAPIPRPRKNIVCVGRNYAAHARESRVALPQVPVFFTKAATCVVGPEAPVVCHAVTRELDYEVELAVIIGRRGRDLPEQRALDYVFGYTILNDITARDLQRAHEQWFKGKSLDTFGPMGPAVLHRLAVRDPQDLRLRLRVNGQVRQDASTREMVFPVARLISVLSAGMTLEPGDILATGTPEGVAMGQVPPPWLRPGDLVEAEIDGIGVLRNPVVGP